MRTFNLFYEVFCMICAGKSKEGETEAKNQKKLIYLQCVIGKVR
jgi:hypothetical protein